jgi:uncharacterized membrane protein YagU involved in acid resistance
MIAKAFQGGLTGLVATAPMTAAMLLMHRMLPPHEREALPPRQITMQVARKARVAHDLDRGERKAATLAAHYSFGTAMGTVYGLVCSQGLRPGVSTGMMYGLCVWAGNYLGMLPGLGLLSPATKHPPRRTLLMVVAHLVWGAVVGLLMLGLNSDKEAKR